MSSNIGYVGRTVVGAHTCIRSGARATPPRPRPRPQCHRARSTSSSLGDAHSGRRAQGATARFRDMRGEGRAGERPPRYGSRRGSQASARLPARGRGGGSSVDSCRLSGEARPVLSPRDAVREMVQRSGSARWQRWPRSARCAMCEGAKCVEDPKVEGTESSRRRSRRLVEGPRLGGVEDIARGRFVCGSRL